MIIQPSSLVGRNITLYSDYFGGYVSMPQDSPVASNNAPTLVNSQTITETYLFLEGSQPGYYSLMNNLGWYLIIDSNGNVAESSTWADGGNWQIVQS